MFLTEALHNCELADIGVNSYRNILEQIISMVQTSQERGEIDPELSATAIAQVLFSLVQGMSTQMIMSGNEKLDIDKYLQATLATMSGELFTRK